MSEELVLAGQWVLAGMAVFALIVCFQVALRLLAFIFEQLERLKNALIIEITACLERLLIRTGALLIAIPCRVWRGLSRMLYLARFTAGAHCQRWHGAWQEHRKLRELYQKYGAGEFRDFAQFKRAMRGEEIPEDESPESEDTSESGNADTKAEKPESRYEQALSLFGFSNEQEFDRAALKSRYRALISKVHPDKGYPTAVFAAQINEAYDLIRKRRNWK